MSYPYISGIDYESVADGPGVRAVIYLSGCNHRCEDCHNPNTHDPKHGVEATQTMINKIAQEISRREVLTGITLSGGDPLYDIQKTADFVCALHDAIGERWSTLSVWMYTGYTWEQIIEMYKENPNLQRLLLFIDVVVDGPFIKNQADKRLSFRGSKNQRLISVKRSLQFGKTELFSK